MAHECEKIKEQNIFRVRKTSEIKIVSYEGMFGPEKYHNRLETEEVSIFINYCPFCGEKLKVNSD